MCNNIALTVFTPTFNRRECLTRCYQSICEQTSKEFEWLIVDDGSTDNTEELVKSWINSTMSPTIRYIYKPNGGLHTAYNTAIENIDTELCMCIDSDDWMPKDAVEKVLKWWDKYGSDEYAGIVGLDYTAAGEVIGDFLPQKKSVNLVDLLVGKYQIKNGDRTNVVRTVLYKQFAPMKVFPGEKDFNPHYMHLQISQSYDFLVLNENLRYVEYQPLGMSNSILKQYRNSPRSFAEIRKLYLSFPNTKMLFRAKHTIHLASSCILYGEYLGVFKYSKSKLLAFLGFPFGLLLALYIIVKTS